MTSSISHQLLFFSIENLQFLLLFCELFACTMSSLKALYVAKINCLTLSWLVVFVTFRDDSSHTVLVNEFCNLNCISNNLLPYCSLFAKRHLRLEHHSSIAFDLQLLYTVVPSASLDIRLSEMKDMPK